MYSVHGLEVFVSFATEAEARAYAVGKLEEWFRCARLEAPDEIHCKLRAQQWYFGRPISSQVVAKLGTEEKRGYTIRLAGGKFGVIIPELDEFAGVKSCRRC